MAQLVFRLGYGKYGILGNDTFSRIAQEDYLDTEEVRMDYPSSFANAASYIGIATAASATSAAVWGVMKTTYDVAGNKTRVQYQANITWDGRASGW